MSDWITDRRPTEEDVAGPHRCVFDGQGHIVYHALIMEGQPWKPIPKCEPYVKPKRYRVTMLTIERWCVIDVKASDFVAKYLPTEEAAERIAAIYEEVMQFKLTVVDDTNNDKGEQRERIKRSWS